MKKRIKFLMVVILLLNIISCDSKVIINETNASKPNYNAQYIAENLGKAQFEIPEVLELSQIAVSLTSYSNKNRSTQYWKDVEKYFAPYKSHPLIPKLEARVKEVLADYDLRQGAFAVEFDSQGKLVDGFYPYLAGFVQTNKVNPFLQLQTEFQDFAEKSNFRTFYQSEKTVYDEMKRLQEKMMPVKKMWIWLENRFPSRSQSYKIIFSPLFGSNHNTFWFGDEKTFRESLMMVSYVGDNSNSLAPTEEIKIGLASRVVFTEIDHNYVNPVSDTYLNGINEAFGNRSKWVNLDNSVNANFYKDAYSVFNEYMTWAIFTLYAYDNFVQSDFEVINQATTNLMVGLRGFPKYKGFNEQLIAYYKENRQMKSKDFFDKMLAWAKTQ